MDSGVNLETQRGCPWPPLAETWKVLIDPDRSCRVTNVLNGLKPSWLCQELLAALNSIATLFGYFLVLPWPSVDNLEPWE